MQYTEDEFLQTLDWRPHAKADFHVCKKQPKELEDETKDILKIEEDQDNEKFEEDTVRAAGGQPVRTAVAAAAQFLEWTEVNLPRVEEP